MPPNKKASNTTTTKKNTKFGYKLQVACEVKTLQPAAAVVSGKHRPLNHSMLQTNGCDGSDSLPA